MGYLKRLLCDWGAGGEKSRDLPACSEAKSRACFSSSVLCFMAWSTERGHEALAFFGNRTQKGGFSCWLFVGSGIKTNQKMYPPRKVRPSLKALSLSLSLSLSLPAAPLVSRPPEVGCQERRRMVRIKGRTGTKLLGPPKMVAFTLVPFKALQKGIHQKRHTHVCSQGVNRNHQPLRAFPGIAKWVSALGHWRQALTIRDLLVLASRVLTCGTNGNSA